MKDQELDDLFAKNLKDAEAQPPAGLWDKIASELPADEPVSKKPIILWRYFAAAAAIMLFFGIGMYVYRSKDARQPVEHRQIAKAPELSNPMAPEVVETREPENPNIPVVSQETSNTSSELAKLDKLDATNEELTPTSKVEKQDQKLYVAMEKHPVKPVVVLERVELPELKAMDNEIQLSQREVTPIQPLVNIIENEELMYAQKAITDKKPKQSIITKVLNGIADNINIGNGDVSFSNDEEGNIRIDLTKSLARNRR